MNFTYYATCPLNFEDLLEQEIHDLGGFAIKREKSGARFSGDKGLLYRAAMGLRVAGSLRLLLLEGEIKDKNGLYVLASSIAWQDHMGNDAQFACNASHNGTIVAPENYLMLVLKDAIVDSFQKTGGRRPTVNSKDPDLLIHLHINSKLASISLELGQSLFKRGYRYAFQQQAGSGALIKAHAAPLKEPLAACLLYRAGWPEAAGAGQALIDPMCGSGVFLLEAYMMACGIAPNLKRRELFGFEKWRGFDQLLFTKEKQFLEERSQPERANRLQIFGYDIAESNVKLARQAILTMDAQDAVMANQADALSLFSPVQQPGLIVSNPPYGQRLMDKEQAQALYSKLGANLKKNFKGWQAALVLPQESDIRRLDVRVSRINAFYNGAHRRILARFALDCEERSQKPLSESAAQLKNRMEKRYASLQKLAKEEWRTDCYRLYDADLPEYNAACDIYGEALIVQEYQAPKDIPVETAQTRLKEILRVCHETTGILKPDIYLKLRRKQKPQDQYTKDSRIETQERVVHEDGLKFIVNLSDYVDSGLYIDHRPLRRRLKKEALNKSFLNLFCYTGAATVAAAEGGATRSVSIDASRSYLRIAERNMEINGLAAPAYSFVKSDVREYFAKNFDKFDIIFLDPPTFSNSKARGDFDIQQDHVKMIEACVKRLAAGGTIYFSTHYRRFLLDQSVYKRFQVEDLTMQSLDEDFKRRPAHRLWRIQEPAV